MIKAILEKLANKKAVSMVAILTEFVSKANVSAMKVTKAKVARRGGCLKAKSPREVYININQNIIKYI